MKNKKKYEKLVSEIIDVVGGRDNITIFRHCVTRLRFNVKDKSIVNTEKVEKFDGVLGYQWSGEQLQIIVGNDVSDVYAMICKTHNFEVEKVINETLDKENKWKFTSVLSRMLDAITGSVTPCIVMLGAAGMLKVIVLICTEFGWVGVENPTLVTLSWVSDASFYFLPIFVGGFAAKKFGANIGLGMLIGAMLIHPTFVSMVEAGDAGSIYGLPIHAATYSSSIIPAVLSVWIMAKIEKILSNYISATLRVLLLGVIIILIMIPLTLVVIAPLGSIIGEGVTTGLLWLYDTFGFFAIGILTALMPLIVMTGMHFSLFAVYLTNISTLGYDPLVGPAFLFSNIGQGAACLAVAYKSKKAETKALGFSTAFQSAIAGISEPAMYGITLKYKTPMISAIIGCFCGGCIIGLTSVKINAFLAPNIFSIPAYLGENPLTIVWFFVAFAVTCIVTFVVCILLYKEKVEEENETISK